MINPRFRYFPEIDAFCWFEELDHTLYKDGIPLDYLTVLYDNKVRICFNFTEDPPGWISADLWGPYKYSVGYDYKSVSIPRLTPVQLEFAKAHGFEVPKWGA